jgi:hypothetical protein
MSTPKYEDLLRRELEGNPTLTNKERLELLAALAGIESKKIDLARDRAKSGQGKKKDEVLLDKKPREKLVNLPPERPDEPTKPMGQQVNDILAELEKARSELKALEEKPDGSGKLNEPAGPDGHQPAVAAADTTGS